MPHFSWPAKVQTTATYLPSCTPCEYHLLTWLCARKLARNRGPKAPQGKWAGRTRKGGLCFYLRDIGAAGSLNTPHDNATNTTD